MAKEYTPEQKAEALRLYAEGGPSAAAKATGIPRTTISRWASEDGTVRADRAQKTRAATEAAAEQAAQKRETLKAECRDRALDLIQRMTEEEELFVGKDGDRVRLDRAAAASCRELATAAGILIDKAELLDGRATSRNEHRNIDAMDREIEGLLGEMAANDHGEPAHT